MIVYFTRVKSAEKTTTIMREESDILTISISYIFEVKEMLESAFKRKVLDQIKKDYPGCFIIKVDDNYIQGFPDTIVLYNDKWFALEFKRSGTASKRPNQEYYIRELDRASYARFIYPENKEEVLDGIQQTFEPSRKARGPKP